MMKRRLGILILALAPVLACSPLAPEDQVSIRTDRTEYALEHQAGLFTVEMEASVTNNLQRVVYLHRACGYGDEPSKGLERAGNDTTRIRLGEVTCITQPLRKPIPLLAGETYRDRFVLRSSKSPGARPRITMEMRTGTFRLVYDVQLTDRVQGWRPVDPLSARLTSSNVFTVRPPDG